MQMKSFSLSRYLSSHIFSVICKTLETNFFFNTRFLPIASIFLLKNKLKSPVKTIVFVSSREKSDRSRSTSLSVCSCSVSEFELQRFNKTNVHATARTCCVMRKNTSSKVALYSLKVSSEECVSCRNIIPLLTI